MVVLLYAAGLIPNIFLCFIGSGILKSGALVGRAGHVLSGGEGLVLGLVILATGLIGILLLLYNLIKYLAAA